MRRDADVGGRVNVPADVSFPSLSLDESCTVAMCLEVHGLPRSPRFACWCNALPILVGSDKVLRGVDTSVGDGEYLWIAHG